MPKAITNFGGGGSSDGSSGNDIGGNDTRSGFGVSILPTKLTIAP